MDEEAKALVEVGRRLRAAGYRFTAVTPETHRRVNARAERCGTHCAKSLRDVFGWNRHFPADVLPDGMLELLRRAGALASYGPVYRSRVRFASLDGMLFAHSAFPTIEQNAVFFGPDSYRFCELAGRYARRARRLVDVGCGSGVGGIALASAAQRLVLSDVNRSALRLAEVNAELNGVRAEIVQSDVLHDVPGDIDLVIANPPYLRDLAGRAYRDGGGEFGEALGVRIAREALDRLAPGGSLILYTGSAIVDGVDTFRQAVLPVLRDAGAQHLYQELDPDVFGEELDCGPYTQVDRIAVVGLCAQKA